MFIHLHIVIQQSHIGGKKERAKLDLLLLLLLLSSSW
jgi:hypothetical protein